ncbi:MAG: TRAP transporter large permease subunit [Proteobacteria bacterium]|nr:TRAP transporter large permease subunit [Pseudomonadota bacterium]
MTELFPLLMFAGTFAILLFGFPVAFSLAGSAILFALIGYLTGHFDPSFVSFVPQRIYGVMTNFTLVAVPLFVFMGVTLERTKISEDLLDTMSRLFGGLRGGLGISVCLVGGLLAASTGIVGATVVTMGLISLPAMSRRGYSPELSTGIICASGTLGQIIPPSIVLIILGDVIGSAHQQAQLKLGNFAPTTVSVGELFVGALIPGAILMFLYMAYVAIYALARPHAAPAVPAEERGLLAGRALMLKVIKALIPPLLLIFGVLGSILRGYATPTEAASVGCVGALLLALLKRELNLAVLRQIMRATTEISAMVFTILIGAAVFSLVFRGYGGDEMVQEFLQNIGGGVVTSFIVVMLVMFLLGFFLDFFEITFVVVPLVGPSLLMMGLDPVWLGVMIAINLQTSFLTPPFGFSLFYLRGVAPASITTGAIYRGAIPFIAIQLITLVLLWFWRDLATWLPQQWLGS